MDECPFMEYLPAGRDCMICYDYRSLAFDDSLLTPYGDIRVVAWSMGVWAASRTLSGRHLPVTESIAVNGTPWPVDDGRGIATAIFRGTLSGLNEDTLQKFRRRMCGSREAFLHFMEHAPRRTVEDLRRELERIGELSAAAGSDSPSFAWDRVYIGLHDKIFLPAGQRKAGEGKTMIPVECAHYPSTLWKELFSDAK
jgi:malonyl-CoA O-methyltransferase/biotin synthesis protein BioG